MFWEITPIIVTCPIPKFFKKLFHPFAVLLKNPYKKVKMENHLKNKKVLKKGLGTKFKKKQSHKS